VVRRSAQRRRARLVAVEIAVCAAHVKPGHASLQHIGVPRSSRPVESVACEVNHRCDERGVGVSNEGVGSREVWLAYRRGRFERKALASRWFCVTMGTPAIRGRGRWRRSVDLDRCVERRAAASEPELAVKQRLPTAMRA
jgi:hypothetical protein